MTIKKILFFILLILGNGIYSQTKSPDKFEQKISLLKKSNVDTIITYHDFFNGGRSYVLKRNDTSCRATDIKMIFWVKRGQFFKQRFDNCKDYPEQKLTQSLFIKFTCDSLEAIKNSEIKPVGYNYIEKDGKSSYRIETVSHSQITRFTFLLKTINFGKNVDHYNIDTKEVENGQFNINYSENQNSVLLRLIYIVTKEL
jgi:hypothetical protein